ncbi:TVP38/TMEM64 family protein [Desulfobulbus sp.]|uniref:TVP38/TMEM64 family protein n=1 Tax=Desulfobulbus sp. TaxID=895 RepID=UPI00286F05D2|nr:TVP38/TMEM64 family protein [Desulfobulbus sp.]
MNRGRLAVAAAGLLVLAVFFTFDLGRFLTLDALKANRQTLAAFQAAHPVATVAGFMAIYVAQTALSLPGAAILSLAAGALFGTVAGTAYAVVAATVGASLAFLVARHLLRDAVLSRYGGRLEGLNRELERRGLGYLLFLRLVPAFPFFLINLAAGLTRLPLSTFVCGTLVGIVPGGLVYVNAGASLAAIDSVAAIASPRVLAAFGLLGLFALIPALYGWWRDRRASGTLGPSA